jgi:hypothetical protein
MYIYVIFLKNKNKVDLMHIKQEFKLKFYKSLQDAIR